MSNGKKMDVGHQTPAKFSEMGKKLFHIGMGRCLQFPQFIILDATGMKRMAFRYRLIKEMTVSPVEKPTSLV